MSLATDDVVKVEVWDVVDKGKNNFDTFISEILLTLYLPRSDFLFSPLQGVKLRLIQAPVRLNFSLWRPNPES